MGLDMFLYKKHYIRSWAKNPLKKETVIVQKGGKPVSHIDSEKIRYVVEEAMYWRKANHIHAWFVKNIQNGVDDCGEYYVPTEKLQELLDTINIVLSDSKLADGIVKNGATLVDGEWQDNLEEGKVITDIQSAESLLPTQEGFFFGGTDYDEYYYNDLIETKEFLEEALEEAKDTSVYSDYYYTSSW